MQPRILLDHAASTPPRPEVTAALLAALEAGAGGNPSAGHGVGRAARGQLEDARERVATALGRSPHEVVFTSGGTEADQLAVVGTVRAAITAGRGRHVVCSTVEHPAVRDAVAWLASDHGVEVTWVGPHGVAAVDPAAVLGAVRDDTVLVSLTGADGEVGVLQDVATVAAGCAERGVPLHVDAVQRAATAAVPATGSLALSGHKLGAPAGIGVAVLPRHVAVEPLVPGPGQERGLRSGTQPAALAVALATALELAVAERDEHARRSARSTSALWDALATLDGVVASVAPGDPWRVPTHLHLQVQGVDGESLATALDAACVATSSGTACATGSAAASPVLAAYDIEADATVRCSVGRTTTLDEVHDAAGRILDVIGRLRRTGGGFL